jgi:hypothetical protein
MRARLTLSVGFLVVFSTGGIAFNSSRTDATTAQPAKASARPDSGLAPRPTGYCQIYGCIDLPPDGYCPTGYYRFQGTACCCPIHHQAQAAEFARLDGRVGLDIAPALSGRLLHIAPAPGGRRCGS